MKDFKHVVYGHNVLVQLVHVYIAEEGKREQDRKSSEEEFQLQKEKIQQRFESCATMLAESYDR